MTTSITKSDERSPALLQQEGGIEAELHAELQEQEVLLSLWDSGEYTPVRSSVMVVNAPRAERWLTNFCYPHQRPLRRGHADYLAEEMLKGHFVAGTPIHFVSQGGATYLVNGQHTLAAIVKSRAPQRLTVLRSNVETERDVAEIYLRHDNHLRRQLSDAFRALDLTSETGLTPTQQRAVGSAVAVIRQGFAAKYWMERRLPRDELAAGVVRLAPQAREYFALTSEAPPQIAKATVRRATLAMALVTLLYAQDQARPFWQQVTFDDGLRLGDPRKTLNDFLKNVHCISHRGRSYIGPSASAAYQCRAIALAWNAFYENRPLKLIRVIDETSSMRMSGTPYHGNPSHSPDPLAA